MKEEALCHPAEEVQVQGVHEAVREAVVRVVGVAAHQEDGAVPPIVAPTAVPIEAVEEVHQRILPKEHGGTSLPVCRRMLEQSQLF